MNRMLHLNPLINKNTPWPESTHELYRSSYAELRYLVMNNNIKYLKILGRWNVEDTDEIDM
jgi:hypothetical protein